MTNSLRQKNIPNETHSMRQRE